MKFIKSIVISSVLFAAMPYHANAASDNFIEASKHSSLATVHSVKGSAQVASGVVAVPLIAAGSVGMVSMAAGDKAMRTAKSLSKKPDAPLEITEVTITVDRSPAHAMKKKCKQ
ncbi:hypothetical protein [Pseudoalteromonas sp. T1lg24]|uniref:hypothetical protein n=1 Tax=Pseudoalteromonas sp. T1lg24 TaxID=2077099 RepID=UPI000CF69861|nr:hypothetical protein [Pseudoalteromonas sp. T1lg24]